MRSDTTSRFQKKRMSARCHRGCAVCAVCAVTIADEADDEDEDEGEKKASSSPSAALDAAVDGEDSAAAVVSAAVGLGYPRVEWPRPPWIWARRCRVWVTSWWCEK